MARICPSSARLSLPNVLRSLLDVPVIPQLPTQAMRSSNRSFLPRHSIRSMITVGDIPITTPAEARSSKPAEDNSAVTDSVNPPNDKSPRDAPKTAKPRSSSRAKTGSKKPIDRSATDRKARNAEKPDTNKGSITTGPPLKKKKLEHWQIQKEALKKKFPTGWTPQKKLSPDAMEGIRHLHATSPDKFTTAVLAEEFKVSPEAVRRILKSKWRPNATDMEDRRKRWEKRHDRIWGHLSELGLRPHTERTAHFSDAHKVLYGDKSKP
ncbi:required for respiratory growth protein 9, mitochondrial [Aspergillus pseudoustus]|uniref:Required for respiratory growth protein 9, mitochondrial n=1 Tax=Aspergillus pseudoustus TaxID=1810923 RepID=A0ABR4KE59_9EURO